MGKPLGLQWVRDWRLLHTGAKRIVVDLDRCRVECSPDVTVSEVNAAICAARVPSPPDAPRAIPVGKIPLVGSVA